jgi:hypothetical protein
MRRTQYLAPTRCVSTSGTGKEAFGDGSDRLPLDLGLEAQQLDRGDLVEPFALHDDAACLLDAGVMLHREPQRRGKRLLLTGRGQLQGRHDQPLAAARSWGCHGCGSVRAKSSAPMGPCRWCTGTLSHARMPAASASGRKSGQRGSPARSLLETGASCTNASTDGPSPSRTCEPARERRGLPAAAT